MKTVIVCANIIEKDGKFLLVKETKERVKGQYNLPAGRVDGPESLLETAKKEAKEETGLEVEPKNLVNIGQKIDEEGDKTVVIFSFESGVKGGEIKTSEEHPEVDYFSWKDIEELDREDLLRSVYIKPALEDYRKGRRMDLSSIKVFSSEISDIK
ncbi:MAG: NUDIX domain-containing protein [Candidatus Aenigmatarchaeota archaeon]